MRRSIWSALGGVSVIDAEIKSRLEHLYGEGAIDDDERGRLEHLLIHSHAEHSARGDELPSQSDIAQLHAQVDALASAVEQLLAERERR